MWIVLGAVVLVAVVALVATVIRRPSGDDLHSVRSYHSALGTLEQLAERTNQPSVTVTGPPDRSTESHLRPRSYSRPGTEADPSPTGDRGGRARSGYVPDASGASRSVPPVPVRGSDEFPDPETPLIFDDSRPKDRYRRSGTGEGAPVARMDRAQRHALDSMNHRPRRGASMVIIIAAVAVFGVLAYAGSRSHSPTHHAGTSASSSSPTTARSTPTSTAPTGTGHPAATKNKGKAKTTTTAAPSQIVALSSTSTSAVYPVGTNSYRLTVSATGPCWILATNPLTGSTLWTGTLQAGGVQQIQANSIVRLELGSPAASLAVGGVPVVFPTPAGAPFIATFEPPAAQPGGATSSTSTTSTTSTKGSSGASSTTSSVG